ncbi:MAG TPA: hypothetical protein VFE31_08835 [Opitutaceae bacterium]|jgi:hypothetical protein|nr:hypothetical protein [Opitutaceae bacterium]
MSTSTEIPQVTLSGTVELPVTRAADRCASLLSFGVEANLVFARAIEHGLQVLRRHVFACGRLRGEWRFEFISPRCIGRRLSGKPFEECLPVWSPEPPARQAVIRLSAAAEWDLKKLAGEVAWLRTALASAAAYEVLGTLLDRALERQPFAATFVIVPGRSRWPHVAGVIGSRNALGPDGRMRAAAWLNSRGGGAHAHAPGAKATISSEKTKL